MSERVLIVSNRLPVSVVDDPSGLKITRSNGGLATALSSTLSKNQVLWIGWLGINRQLNKQEMSGLTIPNTLVPVNIHQNDLDNYYNQFSNRILWPLAHGLPANITLTETMWQSVEIVTREFANQIELNLKPNDTIWIHDYHLLFLPLELRKRGIKNRIGFFLHTPFFPDHIQNKLPKKTAIAKNIAACDVFGVQTERDKHSAEHFMEQCSKSLTPTVRSFPIGVDYESFERLSTSSEVANLMAEYHHHNLSGKKVILSMSRLDYTKGLDIQLEAIAKFLSDGAWQEKIIYRLNVAPSRELVPEYTELKKRIETLVEHINKEYATDMWRPITYSYENMSVPELVAWYMLSDVQLNLPVADGMNLVAKEYIAARKEPGVLIITETMGAAAQLKDALIVPPNDVNMAATALKHALIMPESEKAKRWQTLRKNVMVETVDQWSDDFIRHLAS